MAAIYQAYPGGLCGNIGQLTQGNLLSPTPMWPIDSLSYVNIGTPIAKGIDMVDSKSISSTFWFSRGLAPAGPLIVPIMEIYAGSAISAGDPNKAAYIAYMDSSGHIHIEARNLLGTKILDITVTNNGASWAGAASPTGMALVANLDDASRRALWVNGVDRTNDTNYVTWTTYTDDLVVLDDHTYPLNDSFQYNVGVSLTAGDGDPGPVYWSSEGSWNGNAYNGDGPNNSGTETDMLWGCSFDDDCTLLPQAIWDNSGWVRDPQKWNGWFIRQPRLFFRTGWRNTGEFGPTAYDDPAYSELIMLRFPGTPSIRDMQYAVGASARTFGNYGIVNYGVPTDLEPT